MAVCHDCIGRTTAPAQQLGPGVSGRVNRFLTVRVTADRVGGALVV
jgi:hypothetical protein